MFTERDLERADKLAQAEIDAALARHRDRSVRVGREQFLECGETIPEQRRLSVQAELCVECQTLDEQQQRMRR